MVDMVLLRRGTCFHAVGDGSYNIEPDVQSTDALMKQAADEIERLRASQKRLKSAIEFAHAEGFQWPSDPMAEFTEPTTEELGHTTLDPMANAN